MKEHNDIVEDLVALRVFAEKMGARHLMENNETTETAALPGRYSIDTKRSSDEYAPLMVGVLPYSDQRQA